MLVLAVCVQAFVWGLTPRSGRGGALVPSLRPVFGLAYGVVFLGAQLLFCAYHGMRRAAVAVLVVAASVDATLWITRLAGLHVRTGAAAALTSGFGAVALGAWVLTGRAGPAARVRPGPSTLQAAPATEREIRR